MRYSRSAAPSRGIVVGVGVAAVALALSIPVFATTQAGPLIVSVTTSPNPYAIEGQTSVSKSVGVLAYGTGASDVALEGYVTQAGSTGLEGFSDATSGTEGNGVFGYSANGSGVFADNASSSYPAIFGDDSASGGTGVYGKAAGNGVFGTSSAANGVVGVTTTTGAAQTTAGVLGEDESTKGQAGVSGTSSNGTGVYGYSAGTGATGYGVAGDDAATSSSTGGAFAGVVGTSAQNYGVLGTTAANPTTTTDPSVTLYSGVLGVDKSNPASLYDAGVIGESSIGEGVFGIESGTQGVGVEGQATGENAAAIAALAANGGSAALVVLAYDNSVPLLVYGGPGDFSGTGTGGGSALMSLDGGGNMILKGTLTQSGTPVSTVRDARGQERVTYGAQQTQATLEDFGEGRLIGGRAMVALDPTFASALDPSSPYLVFITPEGDTPGVYVTQRTNAGFIVEEHAGRDTVGFAYRIVGRPRALRAQARLPLLADVAHAPGAGLQLQRFSRIAHAATHRYAPPAGFRRPVAARAPRTPAAILRR